jgi:pimeloyl-ACP methyl ester carboxylesterase
MRVLWRWWIAVPFLLAGCVFLELGRDLARLSELAVIQGRLGQSIDRTDPLVVVLQGSSSAQTVDYMVLARPGPYFFAVPAGRYRLAAFEDRNGDLTHQPESEPAVLWESGTEITLAEGERRNGLDIELDVSRPRAIDMVIGNLAATAHGVGQLPDFQLGTVVSLDDSRFSAANAEIGLWQPARFTFEVGAGVYFLEAYDPHKIPVLFVHGALGTPRDFAFLIEQLDHTRFQPWLVYYPTALDLATTARFVNRVMLRLHSDFPYPKIAVVAHSMGGLVARAAINQATEYLAGKRVSTLPVFVSISTPWNGHLMAQLGAEHAPVPAPSWLSMAPGSPFLRTLRQTPLPPETHYHLMFSYRGASKLIGESNDDIVAVSSELPLDLQRAATSVLGFDESHTGILRSAEVSAALNEILAGIDAE